MNIILIALGIIGAVMFVIFLVVLIGGTGGIRASRIVAKRGFTAEVPVNADGVAIFQLPRGFELHPASPALADSRDEFRITWTATLGSYASISGQVRTGELRVTVPAGGDALAAKPSFQDWREQGERDGLMWFAGRPPMQTSSIGAWDPASGHSVTLWNSDAYDRTQARVIVASVLRSVEVDQAALSAAVERIRANVGADFSNRDAIHKVIAEKLAPLPAKDGQIVELPDGGGFIVREGDDHARLIVVLGVMEAQSDPLATARSIRIDPGRVMKYMASGWGEVDGAPEIELYGVWIDAGGKLNVFDIQRQRPAPWSEWDEDKPERTALRKCAQPGRLVFVRYSFFWHFRSTPASQVEDWIDASKLMGAWAADNRPLWIAAPPSQAAAGGT